MVHQFFSYTETDREFYREHIRDRLPKQVVDAHVHLALPEHTSGIGQELIDADWALQSATSMSEEQLNGYSKQVFEGKAYAFVAVPMPFQGGDIRANNAYAQNKGIAALMVTRPEWRAQDCETMLLDGGYAGFKPYPHLVNTRRDSQVSIYEMITHAHLAVLDRYGKTMLLHLPRPQRLADDDNIRELRDIRHKYPKIKIVLAHFGRCYHHDPFLIGIDKLGEDLGGFYFDTAAVLNPRVYSIAFQRIAPEKIIFGTDMPILLWHGRRTWENGGYQNLGREDFAWNRHTEGRETEQGYTLFIYEQLKNLLDMIGSDSAVAQRVFDRNAHSVYTRQPGGK